MVQEERPGVLGCLDGACPAGGGHVLDGGVVQQLQAAGRQAAQRLDDGAVEDGAGNGGVGLRGRGEVQQGQQCIVALRLPLLADQPGGAHKGDIADVPVLQKGGGQGGEPGFRHICKAHLVQRGNADVLGALEGLEIALVPAETQGMLQQAVLGRQQDEACAADADEAQDQENARNGQPPGDRACQRQRHKKARKPDGPGKEPQPPGGGAVCTGRQQADIIAQPGHEADAQLVLPGNLDKKDLQRMQPPAAHTGDQSGADGQAQKYQHNAAGERSRHHVVGQMFAAGGILQGNQLVAG